MSKIRIIHLSDLHFGRIIDPAVVEELVNEVNSSDPHLVAVSGDLTQRARKGQFREAAEFLNALEAPRIVVPGNHDVYPWWRPFSRLFNPYQRYKEIITDEMMPTFQRKGLTALGLNSAYGRTVKGGRISRKDLMAMRRFFDSAPEDDFRILMLHHHLTKIQALGPHDVAHRAKKALEIASETGVDLILCGHLHISHIEPMELVPDEQRVVIASAGTATSSRGRRSNRRTNFYNIVDVNEETFTIMERRYHAERDRFITDSTTRFERARPVESASMP